MAEEQEKEQEQNPKQPDRTHDRLVEIGRFPTSHEAGLARAVLDAEGIDAVLDGEATASWYSHMGPHIGGVRLRVWASELDRAAELLEINRSEDGGDPFAGVDFGDDTKETKEEVLGDTAPAVSPQLEVAFRAAVIGLVLCPPLLNIYSMYLIIQHQPMVPPYDWRLKWVLMINVLAISLLLLLLIQLWK